MRLITNIDQIKYKSAEELQAILLNTQLAAFARKELAKIGEYYPQFTQDEAILPEEKARHSILKYLLKD